MPRIQQRKDGTFIKTMTQAESSLFTKIAEETKERKEVDASLQESINTLSNAHTGLVSQVESLSADLQQEVDTRGTADQNLQAQIDEIAGRLGEEGYSKEEMKLLLSPWKVEEIDVPYTTPDPELFDRTPSYRIREGFYFGDNANIHIEPGLEFKDNIIRRYSIWALMEQAGRVTFNVQYDGDLVVQVNKAIDELGENTYDYGAIEVNYTLKEGWNVIRFMLAHRTGAAGFKVEHDLPVRARALGCLDYRAGVVSAEMIGAGIIQPDHLNATGSYKVRRLIAESTGEPAIVAGNGSIGQVKIGNGTITKTSEGLELNCPLIVDSVKTDTGRIDNRMIVFIDPKDESLIHEVGTITEDPNCFGGHGFRAEPAESGEKILVGGIDQVLRFGSWALTLRMKVNDNSTSDPAIIIRIYANGEPPRDVGIPLNAFTAADSYQLVGATIPYSSPGIDKAGLGLDIVYCNNAVVDLDYMSLQLTTPIAIDLPKHAHNDLYMAKEDIEYQFQTINTELTNKSAIYTDIAPVSITVEKQTDLGSPSNKLYKVLGISIDGVTYWGKGTVDSTGHVFWDGPFDLKPEHKVCIIFNRTV